MNKDDSGPIEIVIETEDPRSGSSLVPMLVAGLALSVIGMTVALIFS